MNFCVYEENTQKMSLDVITYTHNMRQKPIDSY